MRPDLSTPSRRRASHPRCRRIGRTLCGVPEVGRSWMLGRVEPVRPPPQCGVVPGLLGGEVGLLEVLHVLPGEEVLLDDLLLELQELFGAARRLVAGVTGFA